MSKKNLYKKRGADIEDYKAIEIFQQKGKNFEEIAKNKFKPILKDFFLKKDSE